MFHFNDILLVLTHDNYYFLYFKGLKSKKNKEKGLGKSDDSSIEGDSKNVSTPDLDKKAEKSRRISLPKLFPTLRKKKMEEKESQKAEKKEKETHKSSVIAAESLPSLHGEGIEKPTLSSGLQISMPVIPTNALPQFSNVIPIKTNQSMSDKEVLQKNDVPKAELPPTVVKTTVEDETDSTLASTKKQRLQKAVSVDVTMHSERKSQRTSFTTFSRQSSVGVSSFAPSSPIVIEDASLEAQPELVSQIEKKSTLQRSHSLERRSYEEEKLEQPSVEDQTDEQSLNYLATMRRRPLKPKLPPPKPPQRITSILTTKNDVKVTSNESVKTMFDKQSDMAGTDLDVPIHVDSPVHADELVSAFEDLPVHNDLLPAYEDIPVHDDLLPIDMSISNQNTASVATHEVELTLSNQLSEHIPAPNKLSNTNVETGSENDESCRSSDAISFSDAIKLRARKMIVQRQQSDIDIDAQLELEAKNRMLASQADHVIAEGEHDYHDHNALIDCAADIDLTLSKDDAVIVQEKVKEIFHICSSDDEQDKVSVLSREMEHNRTVIPSSEFCDVTLPSGKNIEPIKAVTYKRSGNHLDISNDDVMTSFSIGENIPDIDMTNSELHANPRANWVKEQRMKFSQQDVRNETTSEANKIKKKGHKSVTEKTKRSVKSVVDKQRNASEYLTDISVDEVKDASGSSKNKETVCIADSEGKDRPISSHDDVDVPLSISVSLPAINSDNDDNLVYVNVPHRQVADEKIPPVIADSDTNFMNGSPTAHHKKSKKKSGTKKEKKKKGLLNCSSESVFSTDSLDIESVPTANQQAASMDNETADLNSVSQSNDSVNKSDEGTLRSKKKKKKRVENDNNVVDVSIVGEKQNSKVLEAVNVVTDKISASQDDVIISDDPSIHSSKKMRKKSSSGKKSKSRRKSKDQLCCSTESVFSIDSMDDQLNACPSLPAGLEASSRSQSVDDILLSQRTNYNTTSSSDHCQNEISAGSVLGHPSTEPTPSRMDTPGNSLPVADSTRKNKSPVGITATAEHHTVKTSVHFSSANGEINSSMDKADINSQKPATGRVLNVAKKFEADSGFISTRVSSVAAKTGSFTTDNCVPVLLSANDSMTPNVMTTSSSHATANLVTTTSSHATVNLVTTISSLTTPYVVTTTSNRATANFVTTTSNHATANLVAMISSRTSPNVVTTTSNRATANLVTTITNAAVSVSVTSNPLINKTAVSSSTVSSANVSISAGERNLLNLCSDSIKSKIKTANFGNADDSTVLVGSHVLDAVKKFESEPLQSTNDDDLLISSTKNVEEYDNNESKSSSIHVLDTVRKFQGDVTSVRPTFMINKPGNVGKKDKELNYKICVTSVAATSTDTNSITPTNASSIVLPNTSSIISSNFAASKYVTTSVPLSSAAVTSVAISKATSSSTVTSTIVSTSICTSNNDSSPSNAPSSDTSATSSFILNTLPVRVEPSSHVVQKVKPVTMPKPANKKLATNTVSDLPVISARKSVTDLDAVNHLKQFTVESSGINTAGNESSSCQFWPQRESELVTQPNSVKKLQPPIAKHKLRTETMKIVEDKNECKQLSEHHVDQVPTASENNLAKDNTSLHSLVEMTTSNTNNNAAASVPRITSNITAANVVLPDKLSDKTLASDKIETCSVGSNKEPEPSAPISTSLVKLLAPKGFKSRFGAANTASAPESDQTPSTSDKYASSEHVETVAATLPKLYTSSLAMSSSSVHVHVNDQNEHRATDSIENFPHKPTNNCCNLSETAKTNKENCNLVAQKIPFVTSVNLQNNTNKLEPIISSTCAVPAVLNTSANSYKPLVSPSYTVSKISNNDNCSSLSMNKTAETTPHVNVNSISPSANLFSSSSKTPSLTFNSTAALSAPTSSSKSGLDCSTYMQEPSDSDSASEADRLPSYWTEETDSEEDSDVENSGGEVRQSNTTSNPVLTNDVKELQLAASASQSFHKMVIETEDNEQILSPESDVPPPLPLSSPPAELYSITDFYKYHHQ